MFDDVLAGSPEQKRPGSFQEPHFRHVSDNASEAVPSFMFNMFPSTLPTTCPTTQRFGRIVQYSLV